MVTAEFQELPDLKGLQSSLSCSPNLKSVSPPPSPRPSLPFSCPEIPEIPEVHRSACPRSTHGAQRGETGQERDKHPQILAPASLGRAHPSPSQGWDLGQGLLGPAGFEEASGKADGELGSLPTGPGWRPQEIHLGLGGTRHVSRAPSTSQVSVLS